MLLRRVIKHFKNQEWTAICIDFLIVVLGVFVATQVATWNEGRADNDRARAYLERLNRDIESDISNAHLKMQFWEEVLKYGKVGLDYAETGNDNGNSKGELLLAYFHASQVNEYYVADITYQEMKSAGDLGLINGNVLREALGGYYQLGNNASFSERPKYREHVRSIIPIEMQSYFWANCFSSDGSGEQTMLACGQVFAEDKVDSVIKNLVSNQTLMQELRYWMSSLEVALLIGQNTLDSANRVKALIEQELRTVGLETTP